MRNRKSTWRPSSRKAMLRQASQEEGLDRRPRDSLELLRWYRQVHPASRLPDPLKPEQRKMVEELERIQAEQKALAKRTPANRLTETYRLQSEMSHESEKALGSSGGNPKSDRRPLVDLSWMES